MRMLYIVLTVTGYLKISKRSCDSLEMILHNHKRCTHVSICLQKSKVISGLACTANLT